MDSLSKTEQDRLIELAHAGAAQAADALAQLIGHEIFVQEAIVRAGGLAGSYGVDGSSPPDLSSTGVFFEFEGCLDAAIGILFPGPASDRLVRRIVGMESEDLEETIVESALTEVGNILASHVASAIADRLAARLLPSIPSLAMSEAESELATFFDRFAEEDAPRIESRLRDEAGELIGRLILVPTR